MLRAAWLLALALPLSASAQSALGTWDARMSNVVFEQPNGGASGGIVYFILDTATGSVMACQDDPYLKKCMAGSELIDPADTPTPGRYRFFDSRTSADADVNRKSYTVYLIDTKTKHIYSCQSAPADNNGVMQKHHCVSRSKAPTGSRF